MLACDRGWSNVILTSEPNRQQNYSPRPIPRSCITKNFITNFPKQFNYITCRSLFPVRLAVLINVPNSTKSLRQIAQFTRPYSTSKNYTMPLIAPGINSPADGNTAQNWMQKLAGKKITDGGKSDDSNFAKGELPQGTRVLNDDSMMTMDHRPDR